MFPSGKRRRTKDGARPGRTRGVMAVLIIGALIGMLVFFQSSTDEPVVATYWDCVAVPETVVVGLPFDELSAAAQAAAIQQHATEQKTARWFQTQIARAEREARERPDDPLIRNIVLELKARWQRSGVRERASGSPRDHHYSCAEMRRPTPDERKTLDIVL